MGSATLAVLRKPKKRTRFHLIGLNYNGWVQSSEYRKERLLALGLQADVERISSVSNFGRGSSFDKFKFKDRPQEMEVFDRWRHFVGDPEFRKIVEDRELERLSIEFFAFPKALELGARAVLLEDR